MSRRKKRKEYLECRFPANKGGQTKGGSKQSERPEEKEGCGSKKWKKRQELPEQLKLFAMEEQG